MKKGLIVLILFFAAYTAAAQVERKTAPRDSTAKNRNNGKAAEYMAMFRDLDLTADQRTQLKDYIQETQKKLAEIKANSALSADDKKKQALVIRGEQQAKIAAVLNPEQRAKIAAAMQRQKEYKAAQEAKKN